MEIKNKVLYGIWEDRYRKNSESLSDGIKRVADYIGEDTSQKDKFYHIMNDGLFLPAGRTMSNSGIGKHLTLNNCFLAGNKVLTKDGYKNIEDVKIGEYVITEDNTWRKVINTISRDYDGDVYKISSDNIYGDIYCTPNHRFLTSNGWKRADNILAGGKQISICDRLKVPNLKYDKTYDKVDMLDYFECTKNQRIVEEEDKVRIESYTGVNRFNDNKSWRKVGNGVNRFIDFTPEVRYFIGRWIGDGSITRYRGKRNHSILQIVFNKEKERDSAEYCKKIGDDLFGIECSWQETNQNVIALRWCSEIISTFFFKEFGEKCNGKYLKDKYIGDIDIARGLIDADGFIDTHGSGVITLKNYGLIKWLRETLYLNGLNTREIKKSNQYEDTYSISWNGGLANKYLNHNIFKTFHDKKYNKITSDRLYLDYITITNIDILENQKCKVYNLSVEDVHSYVVNGVVVHNCFLNPVINDDMESIFDGVKLSALTHKAGGGIGMDFSRLRPNGSPTSNDAIASGVVSFMEVYNTQTATIMQGSRRGANMGVLNIYHPDIYEYIDAKSYDEGKLIHFNMSVMVDDDFMKAVENDGEIYLRYPVYDDKYQIIKDESKWKYKKKVKARELWDKITNKAYLNGEPGVLFYDNMNKDNNTWYTETITHTNPCGEYLAGTVFNQEMPSSEYGGACNLGSVFLHNIVDNPFTKDATLNIEKLKLAVRTGVELLDRIIDINNFPSKIYENYQKNFRTIGLGVTGLSDAMVMLGITYGSYESEGFTNELMNLIAKEAYKKSIELAIEKGSFPFLDKEKFVESGFINKHLYDEEWVKIKNDIRTYGIRNARLISVAPTGTLSLTYGNNCSSGLEPIFSLEYDRKVKIGGQSEDNIEIVKMQDYAYGLWKDTKVGNIVSEDTFVTAMNLSVDDHIRILSRVAFHTDMSCSKTINIPTEYTFEDTKEVYFKCWKAGIKGCTIFRPNEIRQGILIIDNKEEVKPTEQLLQRGDWKPKADDTVYYQRKIKIGCGKLSLFIGWSNKEQTIQDLYVQRTGSGGCEKNIQSTVIAMSGMLRLGGNIFNIEKAFDGLGACNSFITQRVKGKELSKGSSCGTAILNEIKLFLSEVANTDLTSIIHTTPIDDTKKSFSLVELEFIKNNGEIAFAKKYHKCPICREELENSGGCLQCSCGWSKCD